ncbi:ABC transporter transmembrane domain-containing protein, partial [Rummeliibacillus suwonensis]|uniref:ABC transporter transmembrane domain-containing protein n=1 Tax=Rummeliibacillus suwonensis TaxID=1306154 RepID=UPI001AAF6646
QLDLKIGILNKIFNLKINKFNNIPKGEIINKIENDTKSFSNMFPEIIKIIVDILSFIIVCLMLLKISLILSLTLILICPFILFIFFFFGKKTRHADTQAKLHLDHYLNLLNEGLERFTLIKTFSSETAIINKYKQRLNIYQFHSLQKNTLNIKFNLIVELLTYLSYTLVLAGGTFLIINNNLTIGELIAFSTYSSNFNQALLRFSQVNLIIQEATVSIKRIEDINNTLNIDSTYKTLTYEEKSNENRIDIIKLSYCYSNSKKIILNKITNSIIFPQVVQIKGPNGSGKTTLLNILAGLIDDYEGEIIFNGTNIKDIPHYIYSQKVCLISQTHEIISGSIKENLLLGKKNATFEELNEVCSLVNVNHFIQNLDDGYNTLLGINGIDLSVGQKQKISLARALLVDADVYLFDEATAALDNKNKYIIFELIEYLKKEKGKTIILVSHDTIPDNLADKIILLSN